jgi:hypothetical protein
MDGMAGSVHGCTCVYSVPSMRGLANRYRYDMTGGLQSQILLELFYGGLCGWKLLRRGSTSI